MTVVDSDLFRFPQHEIPDRLISIRDHQIEISHRWEKVEIAVGFISATCVVEGVERAEAAEILTVFINYRLPERLIDLRGINSKGFFKEQARYEFVTCFIQMHSINRQIGFRI